MPNAPPEARVIATLARIGHRSPRASSGTLGELGGFTSDDTAEAPIDRKVDHRRVGGRHPVAVFPFCRQCQQTLDDAGFEMLPWQELSESPPVLDEDPEPNQPKFGWQQRATRKLEEQFKGRGCLANIQRHPSMVRPLASAPFIALPTSKATKVDAQPFRLLLCRRLHLPLPLSMRTCRCGRQLDRFGHHRAACAVAGVLGRRGFPLECVAAQICREARVTTNVHVRDMDLAVFNNLDGRWLEVVADGLTLWHGAQLAIDTTLVSPFHRDGSARARAADHNGAVLVDPELSGEGGRARLVVLAAESWRPMERRDGHLSVSFGQGQSP